MFSAIKLDEFVQTKAYCFFLKGGKKGGRGLCQGEKKRGDAVWGSNAHQLPSKKGRLLSTEKEGRFRLYPVREERERAPGNSLGRSSLYLRQGERRKKKG